MSSCDDSDARNARRAFLGNAAKLAAIAATSAAAPVALASTLHTSRAESVAEKPKDVSEPFWGTHQAGIVTPQQTHLYFAAFDLATTQRADIVALMQTWTQAAARLSAGQTAEPPSYDATAAPSDSGEADGMQPQRLTITFGFGPGLFSKDGVDRYGLAKQRPQAFVDLPHFAGDQLLPERTGGDLCIQACANDPQVAFHAVRQLSRLAYGKANLRWVQAGFLPSYSQAQTPRNLMGFKDGTMNPSISDASSMSKNVWVGDESAWMKNGSYMVARPIRIALEHWDRMKLAFQEQVVGRHKVSGAPLGHEHELDALDLNANDKDGNPVIAENAHVRRAAPESNDGAQILRRGYSYDNGVSLIAERWPPWHKGMEFEAGLIFICFQRDPRTGFIKIFDQLSKFDMMNQFVTHIGGGLFACPPGASAGGYVGQALLETA